MFSSSQNGAYDQCMRAIKIMNQYIQEYKQSSAFLQGERINSLKQGGISGLISKIGKHLSKKQRDAIAINNLYRDDLDIAVNNRENCNYYSDHKIAVYTCILGNYDQLNEPLIKPDNIDYYAITDFEISPGSLWKRIDPDDFSQVKGFDSILKNRFFKFHPHILFPEYKYSIYVDGNFKIYSDFSEHVNRLSDIGISHFRHSKRTCAYKEAEVCRALRKEHSDNIDKYIVMLRENEFPDDYGLLACNIIVREHNRVLVRKIMDEWWYEFYNYLRRDQVSYPYVLFKNGIRTEEVATLGGDVHKDYSFEILRHKQG